MINASFLDELSRFHLAINKRVTSPYQGSRKSRAAGQGLTFKDYRIYAPGDDIRMIDWKVYARTDDLYIKAQEEERNLTVHIIIDCSASMGFGKPTSKFDFAGMIGIGFAYLAMRDNEKIQYSTFAEHLEVFQPKRGMSQIVGMIDHFNSIKTKGESRLKDSLTQYKTLVGSRSLLVLISDFLIDPAEVTEALYTLGDSQIEIIQVLDHKEKELNFEGDYKLIDSETNSSLRTFVSPRLRVQYQKQLDSHCAKIEQVCLSLGMNYNLVTTGTPIFDAFFKILND